jgi:ATP-dependent Lon protease
MNPIIYLDEIDKISETKSKEINGLLTHLLDEEQNNKFQDNYLANVNIDLSQVLFVIAFNHLDKVDPIVMDRMKIIHIQNPDLNDKITIIRDKILPTITKHIPQKIIIDDDLISYVITTKTQSEIGVRQIKKAFEKIINKLNYQLLIGEIVSENDKVQITKTFIDLCLKSVEIDDKYHFMYT